MNRNTTVLTIIEGLVDGCTDKAIKLNMTHTQMCCCFFLSILMRSKESRGGGGGGKNENLTTLFFITCNSFDSDTTVCAAAG